MPEAPNCPIYPDNDVWHSSIQNLRVHPMSASWLANMGCPSRLRVVYRLNLRPVIDGTVWLEDEGGVRIIDVR